MFDIVGRKKDMADIDNDDLPLEYKVSHTMKVIRGGKKRAGTMNKRSGKKVKTFHPKSVNFEEKMMKRIMSTKKSKHYSILELDDECPIMDIKVSQPSSIFLLSKKLDAIECRIATLRFFIKESWKAKYVLSKKVDLDKLKERFVSIANDTKEEDSKRSDASNTAMLVEKLIRSEKKASDLNKKISDMKSAYRNYSSVFVTFKTKKIRDIFLKLIPSSKYDLSRLLWCCVRKKDLLLDGNKVVAKNPPDPINIDWNALDISTFEKFMRRFISLLLTFSLFLIRILPFVTLSSCFHNDRIQ